MENNQIIANTGIIKMFNGVFGFINSNGEDIFFHKNNINDEEQAFTPGTPVEFIPQKSTKKIDKYEATNVKIIEKHPDSLPSNIGEVKWYNEKGFGVITENAGLYSNKEYFFHISSVVDEYNTISVGSKCIFDIIPSKKHRYDAVNVVFIETLAYDEKLIQHVSNMIDAIGFIDTKEKFNSVVNWLELIKYFDNDYHHNNINASPKFLIKFWLSNYITFANKDTIVRFLVEEKIDHEIKELYLQIFTKLSNEEDQEYLVDNFMEQISIISSDEIYSKILFLLKLNDLSNVIKKDIIDKVYIKSTDEYKYRLWLDGYTEKMDIYNITQNFLIVLSNDNFNRETIKKTVAKLEREYEQKILIDSFVEQINLIDSNEEYSKILFLYNLAELSSTIKKNIIEKIYSKTQRSDSFRRYNKKVEIQWINEEFNHIHKKISLDLEIVSEVVVV